MNNAWIETLDTPTIEEVVDEIGYDVLDSILEDGDLEDDEFESAMDLFNDTLMQNSLDLDLDIDIFNDPLVDIEASLEPIMLDNNVINLLDNVDVEPSLVIGNKSTDKECNISVSKKNLNIDKAQADTPPKMSPATQQSDNSERKDGSNNSSSIPAKDSDTNFSTAPKSKKKALPSPNGTKYRDCSLITDEAAVADIEYDNLRGRTKEAFPVKLHKVIEYSERYGFSSIISWMPHGRSFKIHNEDQFVEKVMSHFFFQSKMSSFTRQLRMYGFHKIKGKSNVDKGAYFNELFLRGRPGLCHGIVRLDKPLTLHKNDEPSFYLYPPMPSSNETGDPKAKSETPTCIRYSDNMSTEKPLLLNKRIMNVPAGVNSSMPNPFIQNSGSCAVNAPTTSPHIYQHPGRLPQAINRNVGKNVQVVYVFQGGPVQSNNSFPLNYARSQNRLI